MNQKAHEVAASDSGIVEKDGMKVAYHDPNPLVAKPFAELASLKKDAPAEGTPTVMSDDDKAEAARLIAVAVATSASPDASKPETGKDERRGHRRHKKPRNPGAVAVTSPQSQPKHGGGIRKIEIVSVEPASPPRGSIGLFKFVNKIESAAYLAHCANEIIVKGGAPDVVVWSKSESGFDHARIKVVVYEGKDQKENPQQLVRLEISEATGKYADLAKYIGQKLYLGEVLGKRNTVPPHRANATVALNAVLVEAHDRLAEADAKKKRRESIAKQEAGK